MDKFQTELEGLEQVGQRMRSDGFGRHEYEQLKRAAGALATIYNSDPTGSSQQHAQRVALAAQKFQGHAVKVSESLAERERQGLRSLEEQRRERLGIQSDKAYLPIIQAFQQADSQSRLQWLREAVESGDGRAFAALLETPHYVHGIAPEILQKHLDAAEQRHAPELWERRQAFASDVDAINAALRQAERIATQAVDLESIERADAASKAEDELNDATA